MLENFDTKVATPERFATDEGDRRIILIHPIHDLLAITRVGESLAASPLLQSGDLEAFELQARQLLGLQGWYVILTDRDGRQILNTTFPAGNPLPEGDGERIREVIETGKPQVTNLLYAAARMPLVA